LQQLYVADRVHLSFVANKGATSFFGDIFNAAPLAQDCCCCAVLAILCSGILSGGTMTKSDAHVRDELSTSPPRQQEMLDAVAAAIEHDRKRRKDEKTISNARVPFIFIAAGADDTVRARALSSGERARHDFRLRARPAAALDRWRQHLITTSARRRPASRTGIRRPFRRQSERMRHHQRLKLQGVWAHQTF
jgi:hypothetical protein